MTFLITFIVLSILNVVFYTVRSITTIKSSKVIVSLASGGYFAFYNVMLIYTVMDFPMWQKCLITFSGNVASAFVIELFEELMHKDKLWKVEAIINKANQNDVCEMLNRAKVPYNYIEGVGKYVIFNVFCATQKKSTAVKEILKAYIV